MAAERGVHAAFSQEGVKSSAMRKYWLVVVLVISALIVAAGLMASDGEGLTHARLVELLHGRR